MIVACLFWQVKVREVQRETPRFAAGFACWMRIRSCHYNQHPGLTVFCWKNPSNDQSQSKSMIEVVIISSSSLIPM